MQEPQWFASGHPVENLYHRSADAEFIIDDDFAEERGIRLALLNWKFFDIPAAAFCLSANTLESHLASMAHIEAAHEVQRLASLRNWFGTYENAREALVDSPLLVTLHSGRVRVEDGWHRLGVALFEHHLQYVPALCAAL